MQGTLEDSFKKMERRKERLLQMLGGIPEETLVLCPGVGKWSVAQVLKHLSDAERGTLFYCMKKIKAGDQMPNASKVEDFKMKLFNSFLRTRVRYKMPKGLRAPEEESNFDEVCIHWYNTRESWRKFLEDFPSNYCSKAIFKHPVAGRINLNNTLLFFDAHVQHHEYQIERVLKTLNKS